MANVEFNQRVPNLQAFLQCGLNKAPFASFIWTYAVGNKEEFVRPLYDGMSENAEWWDCWSRIRWHRRKKPMFMA
jgi:hypothetical protein